MPEAVVDDGDDINFFYAALKLACSNGQRSQVAQVRVVDAAANFASHPRVRSKVVPALEDVFAAAESGAVDRPSMSRAMEVVNAISTRRGTGVLVGKMKLRLKDWVRRFLLDFPGETELTHCRAMFEAWLARGLMSERTVVPLLRHIDEVVRRATVAKRKFDNIAQQQDDENPAGKNAKISRTAGLEDEREMEKVWQSLQRVQDEFKSMCSDNRAKLRGQIDVQQDELVDLRAQVVAKDEELGHLRSKVAAHADELATQAEELTGVWARAVKQTTELADLREKLQIRKQELADLRVKGGAQTEEIADARAQLRAQELKHDLLVQEVDRRLGNLESIRQCSDDELRQLIGESMEALSRMQRQSVLRTQAAHSCAVCLERQKTVLLRPCNHMCLCETCSDSVRECPLCRQAIIERIRVHA